MSPGRSSELIPDGADAELDRRISRLVESHADAIADPFPLYDELLARAPIHTWGPTIVVAPFDAVKAIARDSVTFSNRAYSVGSRAQAILAGLSDTEAQAFHEVAAFESLYISRSDGEQHDRLRDIAHRAFTPRKMAELATIVQENTDNLLARMLDEGQDDFVDGFSAVLPMVMINSLLNVPLEDIDLIRGWTARIGKNRGGQVTADLLDAHAALAEFRAYVSEIVDHHERHPDTTDLVSALMGAAHEDRLTHDELLATMVVLLFGGSDTTTALLGNGLHALLANRDQWEILVSDPDTRAAPAVEELLRFVSPVQTTWRVTTAPTELDGVEIPEGNTVLVLVGAANRDPSQFENAATLDITRDPNPHIALFFGAHFCLGASLARLEGATVLATLARRFPGLELAVDPQDVSWRGNIQFRTLESLPLVLGPDHGDRA